MQGGRPCQVQGAQDVLMADLDRSSSLLRLDRVWYSTKLDEGAIRPAMAILAFPEVLMVA